MGERVNMDPATVQAAQSIGAQYGFNAVLILVLLFGVWKMGQAFLAALEKQGARLDANTAALNTVGEAVRTQGRSVDEMRAELQNRATG